MRNPSWWPSEALKISLTQAVDGGTDLESRAQFDIHGRYEMVLSQKQQSLPVYFLWQKLSSQLFTTWTQQKDKTELVQRTGHIEHLHFQMLVEALSNCWPPTLKRRDKPADFFHTPLSRSCWKKVAPLWWEATRSWAVRWRSTVFSSGAGVWGGWGKWRRVILLFFPIAGHILWATGLRVALYKSKRYSNEVNSKFV